MAEETADRRPSDIEANDAPALDAGLLPKFFTGDAYFINKLLDNKPWMVQLPNWALRAIGAPIFLNNPISGVLILVAMFINNVWVAVNGVVGLLTAILTALVLQQDRGSIESGGSTFHGMLVGIVVSSSIDKDDWYPWTIFPVILLAIASVYVASGLGAIFGKFNLPAFNLPFCVTVFMFTGGVSVSQPNDYFPLKTASASNSSLEEDIDWEKIFRPLVLSLAQIYGSTDILVGVLILVAMFVCSPIIATHAVLTSLVSVLTALGLDAPLEQIYDGTWSYNSMLCGTCLGGFFWVLTIQSHLLALFSAFFTTITFGAMATVLQPTGLPVIAFPFVLTASLFLSVTSDSPSLRRVPLNCIRYPEEHRRLYKLSSVDTINPA